MSRIKIAILGAGGHSKVLINTLLHYTDYEMTGIYDCDSQKINSKVLGVPVVGIEDELYSQDYKSIQLVNGIGSLRSESKRDKVFSKFKEHGFTFLTVIHPSAIIALDVVLGEGVQVMAGAIIQPGTTIGQNTILNTRSSVDHDCQIGNHCHIAPGATLSGSVRIGNNSHVGAGATVIQSIKIGKNVTVAAGATVCNDIDDNITVRGVPAR